MQDAAPTLPTAAAALDLEALTQELLQEFERFDRETDDDPRANPVQRLALAIGNRIEQGRLDHGALERLIQYLTVHGFGERARRLGLALGELDPALNEAQLAALFDRVFDRAGDFDAARGLLERDLYGLVLTAHPTFSLSGTLMRDLALLATGMDETGAKLDDEQQRALLARAATSVHHADEPLTLAREQALSLDGLDRLQGALRRIWRIALDRAAARWPDRWRELTPRLVTVASWVGYDLDGRSDIAWSDTMLRRLVAQARELRALHLEATRLRAAADGSETLVAALELLEAKLALARGTVEDEIVTFERVQPDDAATLDPMRLLSQRLNARGSQRLTRVEPLLALVERALRAAAGQPALERDLVVLRAELQAVGLSSARTHVRINATQLHNAIRKSVGLDTEPDDPRHRQSYLRAIEELIEKVEPVTINFGSVASERTSAKRLFMVVAQMLKYIDGTTPVRFLIAECESAFTVLTALYYARMFGIEDKIEICPLFETEKALQMGSRVLEHLLESPSFRAYLRRSGKLCVQTGYSDAGRYLGQTPACGSIERLKERILRLFERPELAGIELVIFDTHGESVGRGGHPGGVEARLDYVCTPQFRAALETGGVRFKQETSWQGGDGYLWFQTEPQSLALLTRIVSWLLEPPPATADRYYEDRDWATEFLTTVKEFQTSLMADPAYGTLLTTWGANLLFQTGSRPSKREGDGDARPSASQLRAIPHNAVLAQLGLLANTIGGVGEAMARDPAAAAEMHASSPRFRRMLSLIEYGRAVSRPIALTAYVETLDPGLWLARAAKTRDAHRAEAMRRTAEVLEEWGVHVPLARIARKLCDDAARLDRHLMALPGRESTPVDPQTRAKLALLHAVRLALVHELFLLATEIPEFSSRHDVANRRIFLRILQLDVASAVGALKRIFPATAGAIGQGDWGEPASYVPDEGQDYRRENLEIFEPMLALYELVRRCSSAIAHRIGFIG
jgi:phosphoenolpyruvate carboxylase